jgi:hypothetical protein
MAFGDRYTQGSVSTDAGSPADPKTIIGHGTLWSATVVAGDLFWSGGIAAPIASVDSDTQLTLATDWPGSALDDASYSIEFLSGLRHDATDLAGRVRDLINRLRVFDAASPVFSVLTFGVDDPPGDAVVGDRYVVGTGTGVFAGHDNEIVEKTETGWLFRIPEHGWQVVDEAENKVRTWTGSAWEEVTGAAGPVGDTGATGATGDTGATGPAPLTPIAPWATATDYVIGPPASFVSQDGSSYECLEAHTSGTFATDLAAGKWGLVASKGLDGDGTGDVVGPAGATSGNIATFSGTTGKSIADSGKAFDTDGALAADSDNKIPTQKAVKAYVDANSVSGPATNTDNYVPQWSGANSHTLKDGLPVGSIGEELLATDTAAAARSATGAPPRPQTASGVGQFITAVQDTAGSGYTLPSGGTWAWYMVYRSSSGTLNGHGAGVAAGGTQVRPGVSGNTIGGFAWRIA